MGALWVVAGTGTDVGKTHVTCALLRRARATGRAVLGYKPVASGVEASPGDDAARLGEACGREIAPRYALREALSPHLAARREGVVIDVGEVCASVHRLEGEGGALLVEGAGGLFSPVSERATWADVAKALGARVLVVAPDRLGVLHDVKATLVAAAAWGLEAPLVVLSGPAVADGSTGTNGGELEEVFGVRVAGVFPRGNNELEGAVAEGVLRAMGL